MFQPVDGNKNGSAGFWEFSWVLPVWSRSKLPRVGSFRPLLFPFVSLRGENPRGSRRPPGGATFGSFGANDDRERRGVDALTLILMAGR